MVQDEPWPRPHMIYGMEKTDMSTTETGGPDKGQKFLGTKAGPLVLFACILSAASLVWTTYSLLDLMKVGAIGVTVAATADVIWSAVIYCEYQGIGNKWFVKITGWITVLIVGGFIGWHGVTKDSTEMAVAGPFLTIGTKIVWELALIALRDPVKEKKLTSAKEIALLDAETDDIMARSDAQIRKEKAEKKAEHERILAEKKQAHELKMADLAYAAQEEKAAAENRTQNLASRLETTTLDRILDLHTERLTIQGQVVPQHAPLPPLPHTVPKALSPVPQQAAATSKMLTMTIGHDEHDLTEAQEGRKRLAALYYLYADDAAAQGMSLSQAAFARQMDETKVQVSRSCKDFPREAITDIEVYRQEIVRAAEPVEDAEESA